MEIAVSFLIRIIAQAAEKFKIFLPGAELFREGSAAPARHEILLCPYGTGAARFKGRGGGPPSAGIVYQGAGFPL